MLIGCPEASGKDLELRLLDPSYEQRSEGNLKVRKILKPKPLQKTRLDEAVFFKCKSYILKKPSNSKKTKRKGLQ